MLSNADPVRTYLRLVPGRELPEDYRRAVEAIKIESPVMKINMAITEPPRFSMLPPDRVREGYSGGMNVDCRYVRPEAPARAFRDLHFRLRGPVVTQLMEVFAEDWQFACGEALRGRAWFPAPQPAGDVAARVIEAGPDESSERLRWALLGGLNAAQRSVRIVTPVG